MKAPLLQCASVRITFARFARVTIANLMSLAATSELFSSKTRRTLISPVRFPYPRTALCVFLLPALLLTITPASASAAATATTTTLAITTGPGGNGVAVTSISTGTAVTLIATVTEGTGAVPAGQVNFCDATVAHCTDTHLVGIAYLASSGTASFTFVPAPGVHSYKAEYAGTSGLTGPSQKAATVYASSSSAASSLTVGSVPTTTITQSGSAGDYALKATVVGTGSDTGPTGTVSFLDTSNSNAVLGSATLGTAASALSWTTPQSPATAAQPNSIVVADFNGDGIPDLAIATNGIAGGNGSVQILLGNGDGTFQAAKTYAGLTGNQLIVAAPFITGGHEDLLVVNNATTGTGSFEDNGLLFTGDGRGNFQAGTPFVACLNSVSALVVGDFNGDGIPDFAVGGILNQGLPAAIPNVAITYGDGTGTFPTIGTNCSADSILGIFSGSSNSPSTAITALGVGDFQGDGAQDIAVLQFNGAIDIILRDPAGVYPVPGIPTQISQTAGSSPTAIAVGDFNGDGYADLAITNGGQDNITVLLGDGSGTNFTAAASPSTGSTPAAIAVGDFNGDGIDDLAVANSGDGTVTILLGNGDGTFTAQLPLNAGNTPVSLAIGPFNGNDTADIAAANQDPAFTTASTATVLLSQLTQTASATATNISPVGPGAHLIEASYPGDPSYAASVSGTTSLYSQTQVAVPNVVGGTQTAATTAITAAGLVVGTVTTASSLTVASGDVISESPNAGTSVNSGSAVNLVVSTGPAQVSVPNVVGQTQAAATTAITGAGLSVGTVTTASSSTVASGNVISESPSAGTSVNTGSAVNLVVSTGPAQVAVPNVVGDTQAAAATAIIGVGLAVGTVSTASSSTVASGNVISESPSAGTSVSPGSSVNLVVSTGPVLTPSYTLIANPSSLTILSGSSASTVITLTPTGGFTGTVNFTCGTLPSDVTCTFLPTSLTVTSSTPLTTKLTIGTTGTAMASFGTRPAGTVLPTLLAAMILLPLGFMRRVLRTRKAGTQWFGLLLLAGTCLAAAGLLGTDGCGGSSSSTPSGIYSIPITVTSGSTSVPLNLSITIQ